MIQIGFQLGKEEFPKQNRTTKTTNQMKKTKPKTKTNKNNELTKQGFWTLYNLWQQKNNSKKD
jgi:hypothetical protein